jgi:hypothetical protein
MCGDARWTRSRRSADGKRGSPEHPRDPVMLVVIGLAFSACGHDIGAGLVRIGRFMARR